MRSLPRYVETREAADGSTVYYFSPPRKDKKESHGTIRMVPLGRDKEAAFEHARQLNEALDEWRRKSKNEPIATVKRGTVAELAEDYKASHFFKDKAWETQSNYRTAIKNFITLDHGGRCMGEVLVRDVDGPLVDRAYMALREQRGLASANRSMVVMGNVFKYGIRANRYTKDNPFRAMGLREPPSRKVRWTEEQLEKFIEKATITGRRSVALAARLDFELAQRGIDIRRLQWSQYNGESIRIEQTKTGQLVDITVTRRLKKMLDETERVSDFVVVRESDHQPYTRNYLAKLARRIRKEADLPENLWLADLRRSMATTLGEVGATEDELRAVTGHQPGRIVGVYARSTAKKAASAIAKLEKARGEE